MGDSSGIEPSGRRLDSLSKDMPAHPAEVVTVKSLVEAFQADNMTKAGKGTLAISPQSSPCKVNAAAQLKISCRRVRSGRSLGTSTVAAPFAMPEEYIINHVREYQTSKTSEARDETSPTRACDSSEVGVKLKGLSHQLGSGRGFQGHTVRHHPELGLRQKANLQ